MFKKLFVALVAISATGVVSNETATAGIRHYQMSTASYGRSATLAFQLSCLKMARGCETSSGEKVAYTSRLRANLASIHHHMDRSFDGAAAEALKAALGHGVPAAAMELASLSGTELDVRQVLRVKTNLGTIVLDQDKDSLVLPDVDKMTTSSVNQ
jgi:predicted transglutaminase-like cysteine proteinase